MAEVNNPVSKPRNIVCAGCGMHFVCGEGGSNGGCWCNDFPKGLPISGVNDCWCPQCLTEKTAEHIKGIAR